MRWRLWLLSRSLLILVTYSARFSYVSDRLSLVQNSRAEHRSTLPWSLPLKRAQHASEICHRYVPPICAVDERYSGPQCLSSDDPCGRCAFTRRQNRPCAQIGSDARVSVCLLPLAEVTDGDGILSPRLYLAILTSSYCLRFIINLPKIRSVVADARNSNGGDKLVLLRVQHEGASGE